jgi:hypothetical protein
MYVGTSDLEKPVPESDGTGLNFWRCWEHLSSHVDRNHTRLELEGTLETSSLTFTTPAFL